MARPVDFRDAELKVQQRFNTQWGGKTAVDWENVHFDPQQHDEFVRFRVLQGESALAGLGGTTKMHRHPGVIVVSVFGQRDEGTKPTLDRADDVVAIFRDVSADEILYRSPSVQKVGAVEGGWYQVNVNIPFQWDGFH